MEASKFRQYVRENEGDTRLGVYLKNNDIAKVKRQIKRMLIENQDIRVLLDNDDISPYSGVVIDGKSNDYSDYLYANIFPFLVLPNTLVNKGAYICFKVDDADDNYFLDKSKQNEAMKVQEIQFMILVHKDMIRTDYDIDRHDALAAIIKSMFIYAENKFPFKLYCVSDIEGTADNNFITRSLVFNTQYPKDFVDTHRVNAYGN